MLKSALGARAYCTSANEIPVHPSDRINADFLRTRLLTLSVQGAASKILEIHPLYHTERSAIALRLPLRKEAEMRDLRGRE
jgi:hypothetical protein